MLFSSANSISRYGMRQILLAFMLLLLLTLTITSFFILKPFMDAVSTTIAVEMAKKVTLKKHEKLVNVQEGFSVEHAYLTEGKQYLVSKLNPQLSWSLYPFIYFVKNELSAALSTQVLIAEIPAQPDYYWFYLPNQKRSVGFKKHLVGTKPELTFLLLIFFLLFIAFSVSARLSQKLNQPLVMLQVVAEKLSQGDFSARLPHHELNEINKAFEQVNQLAYHFKHMLEQRVVFLSGISHDIRTPITRLKLLIAINETHLPTSFISQADKALHEMEALIRMYLDSSEFLLKDETGAIEINNFFENIIQEPQNKLRVSLISELIQPFSLRINTAALQRVIENILNNSLKYTVNEKAEIQDIVISLLQVEDKVVIQITDQGAGIAKEVLEEVFKPFFRHQQNNNIDGSGLGLSICRQICLSQGWLLSLKNNEQQQGLIVTLEIPC